MIAKVDTLDRFEKLRGPWNELLAASASDCFFLTWEWLYMWWKHLAGGRDLYILTMASEGKLIGIAPLAARHRRLSGFPARSLEFLGSGIAGSDYLDLILRDGYEAEAINSLAEYFGDHKLQFELGQLRDSAAAWRLARTLEHRDGYRAFQMQTDRCPYIDLTGQTWKTYLGALGASHRSNFARRLKQLTAAFDFRFERVNSERQRGEALAVLIDLHNKRWRERGASEAFSSMEMIAFHDDISRIALEQNWLRLYVLRLNNRPAAALYGFCRGGRFYFFQSGLDPEYSRYSVGLVTMGLAIKDALAEGAEEYDLLHGGESYKFLWTQRERGIHKLELYPPGVAGLVHGKISHAGRVARKIGWTILPKAMADRIATARRMAQLKGHYAAQSR